MAQGMAVQVRQTLIRWLGGHQLGATHSMSEEGHWQHRSLVSQRILTGGSLVLQGNSWNGGAGGPGVRGSQARHGSGSPSRGGIRICACKDEAA